MFYNLNSKDFNCGCPAGRREFIRNEKGLAVLRCRSCESLDIREFLAGNSECSAQLWAKQPVEVEVEEEPEEESFEDED